MAFNRTNLWAPSTPAGQSIVDESVLSLRVEDSNTALIHDGVGFSHNGVHSVATGANLDHLIVTPSNKNMHLKSWVVKADAGPMSIKAYEGTVTSANGTSESIGNNNRQSSTTNSVLLYLGPTVTSVGTLLEDEFIGPTGGGAHVTVGDPAQSPVEWILKKNTKYLLRVTNSSSGTANVYVRLFWYEL